MVPPGAANIDMIERISHAATTKINIHSDPELAVRNHPGDVARLRAVRPPQRSTSKAFPVRR